MKKKTALYIVVGLLIILVMGAWAIDMHRMNNNEHVVFSTWGRKYAPPIDESSIITDFDEAETFSFHAKVLEVHDSYLLVEPLADGNESKSSDRIQVSLKDKTASWPMPVVDDLIKIVYDGRIMESYPAQLGKVYRIEILINKPTL